MLRGIGLVGTGQSLADTKDPTLGIAENCTESSQATEQKRRQSTFDFKMKPNSRSHEM